MQHLEKYVTFQLSGHYFAVPAVRIRELMPAQELSPWSTGGAGILGGLHTRGRLIPVFDLRPELDLQPRDAGRDASHFVIVKSHGGFEFGFTADRVTDSIVVRPGELRNASIYGHGRVRTVVDLDQLVDPDRLFAATFSSNSTSSA